MFERQEVFIQAGVRLSSLAIPGDRVAQPDHEISEYMYGSSCTSCLCDGGWHTFVVVAMIRGSTLLEVYAESVLKKNVLSIRLRIVTTYTQVSGSDED